MKRAIPRRKQGLSTRPSVVGGMDRLGERNTGRVQDCLDAAAHCEKRAASAGDLAAKNAFVAAAICWRDLAQCWQTYSTGMHACSSRRNATNSDGLPVLFLSMSLRSPSRQSMRPKYCSQLAYPLIPRKAGSLSFGAAQSGLPMSHQPSVPSTLWNAPCLMNC